MASPSESPPGEGHLVGGRYVLRERLGEGGNGVVWRADDRKLNRPVAVKELFPFGRESEQVVLRERVRREALATRRLAGHPNVVPVLDVLWEDDRPWIVSEYVDGESLQRVIERERGISPRRAAKVGGEVLDALSAAHREGILHRDVKPGNILIGHDGVARLTDFGIAQLKNDTALTEAGQVLGSPGYIAPERLVGDPDSWASDLWSLGATLYAAVEGHMPYQRDSVIATMNAILTEPVPDAPNAGPLAPVLAGLLDRDPAGRMSPDRAAEILADVASGRAPDDDRPVIEGLEVERPIGGRVWWARDRHGEVRVVKVLPPSPGIPELARSLAERPVGGVVRVREAGISGDGRPYVVMDHADRGSLADRSRGDTAGLVRLGIETARTVAAANEAGVHFPRLDLDDVLFASTAAGDEEILLLPDFTAAEGAADEDAVDEDLAAVSGLVARLLAHREPPLEVRQAIGKGMRGEWPGVAAFADALEAADLSELPDASGLPDPATWESPLPDPATWEPPLPGPSGGAGAPADIMGPTGDTGTVRPIGLPDGPRGYPPQQGMREPQPAPPAGAGRPRTARRTATTTQDVRRAAQRLVPSWFSQGPRRHPDITPPPWPASHPWEAPPEDHGAARRYSLHTPLRPGFRYVHEPLRPGDTAIPLLGNEPLIHALKDRLVNSMGGAILITGFRGVGKSTLIEQALAEIKDDHPRGRLVLPVVLSVARPLETERLLFAIVRRMFEEMTEAGVIERLPAATRQSLVLAYMRTSLSFKETRSAATEHGASVDLDPAKVARGLLGPSGMAIPKASMSGKRSRSLATEAAFLAYSETDVEHDMMRIVRMLSDVPEQRRRRWRRKTPLDLQLVVVLDEVDKLTALQDGLEKVERLLSGIKNVVTMRGAHYLVVAGPDLHDQVVRDSGRGNGIYESIFAWRMYVPCEWPAPERLLAALCLPQADRADRADQAVLAEFGEYLRYKSRGVMRRLLQELNAFVAWEDGLPYLRIETRYQDAISFYARLERSLDAFFSATRRKAPPARLGQDRWRLGAYYVMDWILRGEGRPFTSADVIQAQDDGEFDPLLHIGRAGVEPLLEHLAADGVLVVVREPAQATSTLIPDVAEAQRASYKLDDALLDRLFWILAHNEYERAELDPRESLGAEAPGRTVPIETLAGDRYELWRLIGEGGTSSVYEGRDTLLDRPVAVKLLRTALRGDPRARARFVREAMIAGAVHHPNVVDVYEVVTVTAPGDPGGSRYAIVMELVEGLTLDQELERHGRPLVRETVRLGITLAGALDYLGGKGLARLDLKPHNIVLSRDRGPVIIDLGIAKIVENASAWPVGDEETEGLADPATQLGLVVGTPAYLSPEQARGEEVDIRSDIYALGLVLCTCLTGRHPYGRLDQLAVLSRAMTGDVDTSGLPCSAKLREVLARATDPDVARRYQRPADLADALRDTPEAA